MYTRRLAVPRSGAGTVGTGPMDEHPSVARGAEILASIRDGTMRDLMRYWLRIHPGTQLPARRDFDPAAVPQALRSISLTDVERDPWRFRLRLMGTSVVQAFGRDFTGQYLHEALEGFERSYTYTHRVEVAESGLPSYRHGFGTLPFKLDFAPIERIYLPFASDGAAVDVILGMTVYLVPDSGER